MDKQTLSGYGWIVIVTLVLAVLLALATPFGTFVGDGVVTTVNGLINTSSKAVDEDQIDTMSDKWENKFSTFDKAGSVNSGNEEETLAAGLYDENGVMTMSWQQLLDEEYLFVDNGILYSDINCWHNPYSTRKGDCNYSIPSKSRSLTGKLVVHDSITQIGDYAFGCGPCVDFSGITEIVLPNTITKIGEMAFCCVRISEINIHNEIVEIGHGALSGTNLTSINIPKSVTKIYLSSLILYPAPEISYEGTMAELISILNIDVQCTPRESITIKCIDGDAKITY